jgi:hypothetical protein
MENMSSYTFLFIFSGLIILSYFFSLVHRALRIPSVLLLLGAGIALHYGLAYAGLALELPRTVVEILGTFGLIMIVLEAGLDLKITPDRMPLIRKSFLSALVIFVLSTLLVASLLKWFLPWANPVSCIVYAIPLSIVSSSIVLPSVHHLSTEKKEFLIYEATFSDLLGIMVFNFFTMGEQITLRSATWFVGSLPVALVLSVVVCYALLAMLTRSRINVVYFLLFAVLIVVYLSGKMMGLPSLITIFLFGLVVNNWELLRWAPLHRAFSVERVAGVGTLLNAITAEISFVVRTFFFVLFGYRIDLVFLGSESVWMIGTGIVLILLSLRFFYLRYLHRSDLVPELFYIPRGLITVLLFYNIPEWQRVENFDKGVLFFVILATGVIMMVGSMLYRDQPVEFEEAGGVKERGLKKPVDFQS